MQAEVATTPPAARAGRVRAVDWLRGAAVIVMIECHALVFLSPEHDLEPVRVALNALNGLVAPSFLFAAGFALALVSARASGDAADRARRARSSLRRIGEVVVVANFMRVMGAPVIREPSWTWWARVDILSCIAYSLLVFWGLLRLVGGAPRPTAVASFAGATLVFAVSPFTQAATGAGAWTYLLNSSSGSMFPVFPWMGHVLLGGGVGAVTAIGGGRALRRAALAIVVLSAALSPARSLCERLYGLEEAWILPNAAQRTLVVAALAGIFSLVEDAAVARGAPIANRVVRFAEIFGRSSLSAYFFHLSIIFGFFCVDPFRSMQGKLDWFGYAGMAAGVILATAALCGGLDLARARFRPPAKKPPRGPA